MKKIIPAVMALLVALNVSAQTVPDVLIEDAKGEAIRTSSLVDDATPVIICFWSTVCKPCLLELDAINELLPDWMEEADFRVAAVSVDDVRSSSKAKALAAGHGWEFTMLYDKNQDFQRAMNVTSIPHVFVVDKDGRIVYSHNGYTPGSETELVEQVKKLQHR